MSDSGDLFTNAREVLQPCHESRRATETSSKGVERRLRPLARKATIIDGSGNHGFWNRQAVYCGTLVTFDHHVRYLCLAISVIILCTRTVLPAAKRSR